MLYTCESNEKFRGERVRNAQNSLSYFITFPSLLLFKKGNDAVPSVCLVSTAFQTICIPFGSFSFNTIRRQNHLYQKKIANIYLLIQDKLYLFLMLIIDKKDHFLICSNIG